MMYTRETTTQRRPGGGEDGAGTSGLVDHEASDPGVRLGDGTLPVVRNNKVASQKSGGVAGK